MVFEGTEKKFELVCAPGGPDLRELGAAFWHEVVAASRAQVLSTIHSDSVDAYLLSESSLFVWSDRALMITCGTTRLTDAAELVVRRLGGHGALDFFIYERKNEVFPHQQPTHFLSDAARLKELIPGSGWQFGPEDEHHLFLFHMDRKSDARDAEVTAELLMCGLSPRARALFGPWSGDEAGPIEGMGEILEGFEVDDFRFQPQGYSLNALRGDRYITVHVTPEERGSYASFETNAWSASELSGVLHKVLGVFEPRAFDLIAWDRDDPLGIVDLGVPRRRSVMQRLPSGYRLQMTSYAVDEPEIQGAQPLPL